MAVLTVTSVGRAGTNLTTLATAAAGGGDSFANTGSEYLYIANGAGSSITLTLVMQATTDGQAITNKTVTVTNAERMLVGPFPTALYNDANSRMNVTYSSATTITVAALKFPNTV